MKRMIILGLVVLIAFNMIGMAEGKNGVVGNDCTSIMNRMNELLRDGVGDQGWKTMEAYNEYGDLEKKMENCTQGPRRPEDIANECYTSISNCTTTERFQDCLLTVPGCEDAKAISTRLKKVGKFSKDMLTKGLGNDKYIKYAKLDIKYEKLKKQAEERIKQRGPSQMAGMFDVTYGASNLCTDCKNDHPATFQTECSVYCS